LKVVTAQRRPVAGGGKGLQCRGRVGVCAL
jgi:hypothetical protein